VSSNQVTQNRPCWVTISQQALQHNLSQVKLFTPDAQVMAVIKADGYGHGMEVAAMSLVEADEFAINSLDDVVRLRRAGIDKPITMLSAILSGEQFESLADLGVRPVIYDWQQITILEKISSSVVLPVWVKVDTGMGRLGFMPEELPAVLARLKRCSVVSDVSLMTHLANADNAIHSLNPRQLTQFDSLCRSDVFTQTSILNSAGIVNFSEAAGDMVRPGIMLYGISPLLMGNVPSGDALSLELKPVMNFKSRLLSVKTLDAGQSVGYGSSFVCSRPTTVGVVACGYGDGYPRHTQQGTPVLVNGMLAELIGRVSMDMLTVDITGLRAEVGDEVELWGDNLPVESIAEAAGTIAYELVCGITERVERLVI